MLLQWVMTKKRINNEFYDELGKRWYEGDDHPIALLRREQEPKNSWVLCSINKDFNHAPIKVLDIACGGGFLANDLWCNGHDVIGVDKSLQTLAMAEKKWGIKEKLQFKYADAYKLPFADNSFDAVCMMDFLEHVENPDLVIKEAARVLKPKGCFYFHTFNRNFISGLLVVDALQYCFKGDLPQVHVKELLIKPKELKKYCESVKLSVENLYGFGPNFLSPYFWYSLITRKVHEKFTFQLKSSCLVSYLGSAKKMP